MNRVCSHDDLEALAAGELSPERAQAANAHAAGCVECAEELRWLRSERELMRRRAARAPLQPAELSDLWSGVEARLGERRPRRWLRPASFAMTVAAAAVLAFFAGRRAAEHAQHERSPMALLPDAQNMQRSELVSVATHAGGKRDPRLVLDEAETQWRAAADELEQRYLSYRAQLTPREAARLDQALSRTRRQIGEARALAGGDLQARAVALEGYSEYVQSLHALVSDLEVYR